MFPIIIIFNNIQVSLWYLTNYCGTPHTGVTPHNTLVVLLLASVCRAVAGKTFLSPLTNLNIPWCCPEEHASHPGKGQQGVATPTSTWSFRVMGIRNSYPWTQFWGCKTIIQKVCYKSNLKLVKFTNPLTLNTPLRLEGVAVYPSLLLHHWVEVDKSGLSFEPSRGRIRPVSLR